MEVEEPFNPLHKRNLGFSVAEALLEKPVGRLPPEGRFNGAGIYAIYYTGDFPIYRPVAEHNRDGKFAWPIYVGKAIPEGARRGGFGLGEPAGAVLYKRLREHAQSLDTVQNLDRHDFTCRHLVVDDIWIPLGENLLIEMYLPVWNKVVDGFGNHAPGSGRDKQKKSPWDELHPGRGWAKMLPSGTSKGETERRISEHFAKFPEPRSVR